MVSAIHLLCVFDTDYVSDSFYHTNHLLVACGVGANSTMLPVAHIKTTTTELNFFAHARNSFCKIGYYRLFLFQQVQYQSQGGFAANSRKARELGNGIFQ
jgi:hypothetical protein